jgi:hypothetical protein
MGGISPNKLATSCAECFAWGVLPGRCCRSCYTFHNLHPAGQCAACRRIVAIKQGYCRLCRLQAIEDAKAAGKTTLSEPFLHGMRHQQLFLARMHRDHYRVPGRQRLGKLGTRGLRPKPAAATRQEPARAGVQLQLPLDLRRDFRCFDRRQHADLDNPAVIHARRAARALGGARGWSHELVKRVDEGLVVLLSSHTDEDKVRYSELSPAVRHRSRIAEVLDHLGLLHDDRVPAFETWLHRKLDGIIPGIRKEAEDWIRTLHDGGTRTRPRSPNTVWHYLNDARPILLDWSHRYHHLREVTRDDIYTVADSLHGNKRRHTLCVLRSLFRHCKKNGAIFRDPTTRIPLGPNHYRIILPLETKDITEATSAATTPAARLTIALGAIHSARTNAISQLLMDDIDPGNRADAAATPQDQQSTGHMINHQDHRPSQGHEICARARNSAGRRSCNSPPGG